MCHQVKNHPVEEKGDLKLKSLKHLFVCTPSAHDLTKS